MGMNHTGNVAVVTGAAGGIGAALVERFAAAGMKTVAADVDLAGATATAQRAAERGTESIALACDVANAEDVEALAAATYERFGATHILCNNAGVFQAGFLWETAPEDWEWCFGVNVYGILNGIRSFVPRMLEGGDWGHVVNTASVAAWVSGATAGPYTVSKAAAFYITETLAKEFEAIDAPLGASVLCPSSTRTAIAESHRNRPESLQVEQTPTSVAVNQGLAMMVSEGIEPSETADIVLAAIEDGEFLIPTKPSFVEQLTVRHEALINKRVPGSTIVD